MPPLKPWFSFIDDTGEHRLCICITTASRPLGPATVTRFYLRYEAEVDGEWKPIVEFDNCHDNTVHQHDYDHDKVKGPAKVLGETDDPKRTYHELENDIRKNYKKHKEWYDAGR